jgi:hypothetical protein
MLEALTAGSISSRIKASAEDRAFVSTVHEELSKINTFYNGCTA